MTHTRTYVRVFVVCLGEHGEGHSPVAVRSTPAAATEYVTNRWGRIPANAWRQYEDGVLVAYVPDNNVDQIVIKPMWVDREDDE